MEHKVKCDPPVKVINIGGSKHKMEKLDPIEEMLSHNRIPREMRPSPDKYSLIPGIVTEPPDSVKATYTNDLDIFKIHEAIRVRLSVLRNTLSDQYEEIEELEASLLKKNITHNERNMISHKIEYMREEAERHESGEIWEEYVYLAKPILEEYKPLRSDTVKGLVHIGIDKSTKVEDQNLERRLELIMMYLDVAKGYLNLDITHVDDTSVQCPNCGTEDEEDVSEEGVCTCGFDRGVMSTGTTHKDITRLNSGEKNAYKDRDTFYRALLKCQGKHKQTIPDKVYTDLDAYFTSKHFYPGSVIRKYPELREKTSVKSLIDGLAATNNSKYYSMVNTIGRNYWGWVLPDYTKYMKTIMEDYDRTQKVYLMYKTRASSLNVNIRIYLHLRALGIKCNRTDFKILSSRESLEYHAEMWKIMCDATGLKHTSII